MRKIDANLKFELENLKIPETKTWRLYASDRESEL